MLDFHGKCVLVTGGGAGIGRATVDAFARAGASVVIVEKSSSLADSLQRALEALHVPHRVLVADVTVPQTATDVATLIDREYGGLDVLVNNVGDYLKLSRPFEFVSDDDIEALYLVNLRHIFTITRACIPLLRRRSPGASIVSVSSIEGFRAMPNLAVYGAFKSAVTGFTQSLALELGHEGIRVNLIAPETTDTQQVPLKRMIPENLKDLIPYWIPQGRFGMPEDHASAILFLASPMAAWINGVALHVDGGARAAGGWYRTPDGGFTNMPLLKGA
jgi:3-oxoacyl-[acyl-carrier protein] reductase